MEANGGTQYAVLLFLLVIAILSIVRRPKSASRYPRLLPCGVLNDTAGDRSSSSMTSVVIRRAIILAFVEFNSRFARQSHLAEDGRMTPALGKPQPISSPDIPDFRLSLLASRRGACCAGSA